MNKIPRIISEAIDKLLRNLPEIGSQSRELISQPIPVENNHRYQLYINTNGGQI